MKTRTDNAPLRVLHVCDKFGIKGSTLHGVSRLFSWWFPRWDRDRYDCTLVGLRPFDESAQFLVDHGVPVRALGLGKFDPRTYSCLQRIVRDERIQIIHMHGFGAANFGRLVAARMGIPAVVHEHAVLPDAPLYQKLTDKSLARATRIGIAVSQSVLEYMHHGRFIPRDRLCVVPNGAPLADFKPVSTKLVEAERKRWNVPANRPVIGFIGRLSEQKGLTFLLQAVELLTRREIDVTLMLVGDGDLQPALEAEATARGIRDRVIFTGFTTDTRSIQSLFDIQAFSSLFEGTPLTLFEAMAMGHPIVSTDVDGLGEVLEHEKTALLTPPRQPEALAEAIARLIDTPELARTLSLQAQQESASYDIGNAVRSIQSIYDDIMRPNTG